MINHNIKDFGCKILDEGYMIKDVRLYISAENLFTLTKYPGLDPEKTSSARDLYPINRSYSMGLNITL